MKYLWTEDTGAGLHFWKLVNQLFFDNALVVESKESNQGILDSLILLNAKEEDEYYHCADHSYHGAVGLETVLEILGNGDGVTAYLGKSSEWLCNESPVKDSTYGKAYSYPVVAHTCCISSSGETHKQPAAHIGSLSRHCRYPAVKTSSRKKIVAHFL